MKILRYFAFLLLIAASFAQAPQAKVSNQLWALPGIPSFTGSMNQTGGTLSASQYLVQIVYNAPFGPTLPSIEEHAGGTYNGSVLIANNCPSGPFCSIAIDPITLPAGYTSWSAYMTNSSAVSGTEKLTNCANIASGAGCTITAAGAGAAVPVTNGSILQPPGILASECPPSVTPTIFTPDNVSGWHTAAGVDINSNNNQTSGTLEFCRRTWFTDMKTDPVPGNNALIAVAHSWGTGVAVSTNQDRAMHIWAQNAAGDSTSRYGLEGLQVETLFQGTPPLIGSPDGEVSVISGSTQDNHTGLLSSPPYGFNGLRMLIVRNSTGSWGSCFHGDCDMGALIIASNNNVANFGGLWWVGLTVQSTAGALNTAGVHYRSLHAVAPANVPTGLFAVDIDADDAGASLTGFDLFGRASNEETGHVLLQGKTYLQHVAAANKTVFPFTSPTCSGTGIGTGSCATFSGSSDSLGRMVLTVSGGAGSGSGTATVTFHQAFTSPIADVSCTATLEDNSGAWAPLGGLKVSAHSLSAVTFSWTNGVTPTALADGTYDINYWCWGN